MVARTWIGPSGGSWGTAANWSPSGTPGSTDDLTIPSTFSGTINVSSNYGRHIVNDSPNLTLNTGNSTLTIYGNFTNNGTITNTGTGGNGLEFGTSLSATFTPGNGTYHRVWCRKNNSGISLNLNGDLNLTYTSTSLFRLTGGTFNQNDWTINTRAFTIDSVSGARVWNRGWGETNLSGGTGTVYSQATTTITINGEGYLNINSGGVTLASGSSKARVGNLRIASGVGVSSTGHYRNVDLQGYFTNTGTTTIWGDLTGDGSQPSSNHTIALPKESGGTYTYDSGVQWGGITTGSAGVACTWNIDRCRANNYTHSGNGYTINLNDVQISTVNTSGVATLSGINTTYNIASLYSYQGVGTQLTMSGSGSTYNITGEINLNGSINFTKGTINQTGADILCRSYLTSGTNTKTHNFNGWWVITNDRSGNTGVVSLYDPYYWYSDMSTNSQYWGGFIHRGTGTSYYGTSGFVPASSYAPRVKWEVNGGSIGGYVRELIIDSGCGFSSASTIHIMVGDLIESGNIANATNLNIYLAHQSNFDYYHPGLQIGAIGVSANAASNLTFDITGYFTDLNGGTKSNTIYNLNDCQFTGLISCSGASCTYNLWFVRAITSTGYQLQGTGSDSIINIYDVELYGSVNHNGGTINIMSWLDLICRSYYSSSTTNRYLNLKTHWIKINDRTSTYPGDLTITNGSSWFSDRETESLWDGGFELNGTSSHSVATTIARSSVPRIRYNVAGGSYSGPVYDMIFSDNCGPTVSGAYTHLVEGDLIYLGTPRNNNLSIYLGHPHSYSFSYRWLYDTYGESARFDTLSVSNSYGSAGLVYTFEGYCNSLSTPRTDIVYEYNWINFNGTASLGGANISTYLNYVRGITNTNTQLSLYGSGASHVLRDVNLSGSINFTGGTLTLESPGDWGYVNCRSFSTSGTTTKTLNGNNWLQVNDREPSLAGTITISDPSYFIANWGTNGFKVAATGLISLNSSLSWSSVCDVHVIAPATGINDAPRISGRVKNLHYFNTPGTTSVNLATAYIGGNVTGNVTGPLGNSGFSMDGQYNNQIFSLTQNNGKVTVDDIFINGVSNTVNFTSAFSAYEFTCTSNSSTTIIEQTSDVRNILTGGSLLLSGGTLTINNGVTFYCGSFGSNTTNSRTLNLNGNLEVTSTTNTSARWQCADTTNWTVTGNGWIIHRGAGLFNYGGTNSGAINFSTGANTFNLKILQNMSSATFGISGLTLPAVKSFKNHEDHPWAAFGRWNANTTTITVYVFGDFDLYAPANDDGTYRNKLQLIKPFFAGTDSNTIHNFGSTAVLGGGYGGQTPTFPGITMASSGTLRAINNVTSSSTFEHRSGTLELTSSDITCTAIWLGSTGTSALDTGTRNWVFPTANKHIVCTTNFVHPVTTGLICSGTYYDSPYPSEISGVYINSSSATPIESGTSATTSTPPNFILPNTTVKLASPFYCNSINLYPDNMITNGSVYVNKSWSFTSSNATWPSGTNVYMTGTNDGYITSYGNLASCPITVVDPGVNNTKTVYTTPIPSLTTRIGTITANIRTILSGNPIPAASAENIIISEAFNLLGSWIIKSGQNWDFNGSGIVLSAANAENITDNGGILYFSNSATTQGIFPTSTINNITRNTSSTNPLTITSNNTTITTIENSLSGGGSFIFVDGGLGAPIFQNFNINGTIDTLSYITGPVISSGNVFNVYYTTITNSDASPSNKWFANTGSVNGGNNTGWDFSSAGPAFLAGRFFLVMT